MPILFMALIALAVFLIMGAMVFYAAYAESHTPHTGDVTPAETVKPAAVPPPTPGKAAPRAAGKAAGQD